LQKQALLALKEELAVRNVAVEESKDQFD